MVHNVLGGGGGHKRKRSRHIFRKKTLRCFIENVSPVQLYEKYNPHGRESDDWEEGGVEDAESVPNVDRVQLKGAKLQQNNLNLYYFKRNLKVLEQFF